MSNNNLFGIYFGYNISNTFDLKNNILSIKSESSIHGKIVSTRKLLNNDFSAFDGIKVKKTKNLKNMKFIYNNYGVLLQDKINEFMKKLFESCPKKINIIVVSIPDFYQDSQKIIIEDSIKSIKKETKIYFLKEPVAAIISNNNIYNQYNETIGNFYLILMFYDDLYEISIALYQHNSNKKPDYSIQNFIGKDFNLQDFVQDLKSFQDKNNLKKENRLEKILKEIKELFENVTTNNNNLQKIFILSENKQIDEQYSRIFETGLKSKVGSLKIKEDIIKFLNTEDSIIQGVKKYAAKILNGSFAPKKTMKMKEQNKKEKQINKQNESNNSDNLEDKKRFCDKEGIENNFCETESSEKKDNIKSTNEMINIKSEENNRKLLEMILQSNIKSEENNRKLLEMILQSNTKSEENNRKLQEMILQSNTKSEENNRKLQEMMFEKNRKLQEMMIENNRKLQEMILQSNIKSEENNRNLQEMIFENNRKIQKLHQKYENKFLETQNQIEELLNKVNKIPNVNENLKYMPLPSIISKSMPLPLIISKSKSSKI